MAEQIGSSFEKVTNNIKVSAESEYISERSVPEDSEFFFAYTIQITNMGEKPARLMSRHWIITDGHGRTHEVKGDGVVGEQPVIAPGESYEYSSFCPLETPTGTMQGSYKMVYMQGGSVGEGFQIEIPRFFLIEPSSFN
jgi:ApaG protein